MWKQMTNDQVWKMWPDWDPLHGLFFESGLLTDEPLHDTMFKKFEGKELKKKVLVSAVDAYSGSYVPFLLNDLETLEQRISAVMGSASMPFVFPPRDLTVNDKDYRLMDGATVWNSNVASGIKECLNMTGIESLEQVELDVMLLIPESFDSWVWDEHSAVPPLIRAMRRHQAIKTQHLWEDDLVEVIDTMPEVRYRYLVRPKDELIPAYDMLEFGNKYTDPMMQLGRDDAKKAVEDGPGVAF